MPTGEDSLGGRLARFREITITVTGRKSGKRISIPVWFVLEDNTLYLLPVQGSDTQWYKNVLANPKLRIEVHGASDDVVVTPITEHKKVSSVAEKFRAKYGVADVKRYYSKFDVAVSAKMT